MARLPRKQALPLTSVTVHSGDLFAVKLREDAWFFLRVLLSVRRAFEEGPLRSRPESPQHTGLHLFRSCELVEIARGLHPTPVFPGGEPWIPLSFPFFCSFSGLIGKGSILPAGTRPVALHEIRFPEFVSSRGAFDAVYSRGEFLLDLPLPILDVRALDVLVRTFAGADLPEYYLKNAGLVSAEGGDDLAWCAKERFNLREHPEHARILGLLGLDPNESETTFSSRHGRDLRALLGTDLRPAPPAAGA